MTLTHTKPDGKPYDAYTVTRNPPKSWPKAKGAIVKVLWHDGFMQDGFAAFDVSIPVKCLKVTPYGDGKGVQILYHREEGQP